MEHYNGCPLTGESEQEESAEEEPAAAVKAVKSSTVGKGKRKAAPARAKVYVVVEVPVSSLTSHCQSVLTYLLTVRPMFHAEDKAIVYHDTLRAVAVKGHPSISLPPLSSPTFPLFICTPPTHFCTISKDHT
jgi:hypothetical protein